MASLLYRLGTTAYRRWPFFLVGWLVVMIGVGGVAATMSKPMSDSFTIPGLESVQAADKLPDLMPGKSAGLNTPSVEVVVQAPRGEKLSAPKNVEAVDSLIKDLHGVDSVPHAKTALVGPVQAAAGMEQKALQGARQEAKAAGQPFDKAAAVKKIEPTLAGTSPLSEDGRTGLIDFTLTAKTASDVSAATQDKILDVAQKHADASGLEVEVRGQGMQVQEMGGASELIGIVLALVILALTFGSFVAAGMPIVTAVFGLALGTTGISAMTAFMDISSTTPALASMIGLAVGIDYALFILSRYRNELDHTDDRAEAIGVAVGTAGSAVVFAGLTVVIALAALTVVGIPFLGYMGIGAAATVVIAVCVALTLLPAVLGMFKSKAFGLAFRTYRPKREASGRVLNNGVRWARFIGKKPLVWVLLAVIALGALAVPFKDLQLGMPSDSTAPSDTSRRAAADMISDSFGPGRLDPLMLVVDARGIDDPTARQAAYQKVTAWADSLSGVRHIVAAPGNDKGMLISIQPTTGPESQATQNLLDHLRTGERQLEKQTHADLAVTGTQAIMADISTKLSDALPIYLGIVIGLAFLILMVVFRSLLVPLTATLGFLLSVLATLGVTVGIFQQGTFGIFEGQPIVSFMPIFLVGVVFGLAMDYQVFLVTRVREAHVHGASFREAVVDGFRNSARVVTAAALIMTSVFAGFAITASDAMVQSMGFALATAVVFDAFVVRMLLIPSLMYLMGEKAWYLPTWLDRILPDVDVEGESLQRHYLADHYADDERELVDA